MKLWGAVRWQHPWLLTRTVDWDAALVKALPKVAAAEQPAAERAALAELLADLGDPATRLDEDASSPPASSGAMTGAATVETLPGEVVSVRLMQLGSFEAAQAEAAKLGPRLLAAKAVLLDLRKQPPVVPGLEDVSDELEVLAPAIAPGALKTLPLRTAFYSGYPPQTGTTSGGYYQGLLTLVSRPPRESARAPGSKPPAVALLADSTTPVNDTFLALQRAGARVVSEGPLDLSWVAQTDQLDLGGGLHARIRSAEFEREPTPDVTVSPSGKTDTAKEVALRYLRGKPLPQSPTTAVRGPPLREPSAITEKPYADMAYPSLEYRWLGVARLWNTIQTFYPYLSLLDRPWDDTLLEAIPLAEKAADEEAWLHAVLQITANINDSHTSVFGSPRLQALLGQAGLGLKLQLLDGEPVVVGFYISIPKKAGVLPGDVIETVNGEPLKARAAALENEVAASMPRNRTWGAIQRALRGDFGAEVTLGLRAPDGTKRTVKVARVKPPFDPGPEPTEPPYKRLAGNIGYVDLERITPEQVDAMFDALFDTRALVFDLRNYPRGTAWSIAPRLNVKGATVGALFHRAQRSGGTGEQTHSRFEFEQLIPTTTKPVYRGKVVVLINEFAISQSEHTGLFFESVANVTFIGSPTQGANGDVTNTVLPGGLKVSFTGHDVRHADGRPLQRVGLQPQISVRPTPAGLRAGRDEVLERALKELAP
jgi:C-terminal processing protease CtpA/Prc